MNRFKLVRLFFMFFWWELCNVATQCSNIDWQFASCNLQLSVQIFLSTLPSYRFQFLQNKGCITSFIHTAKWKPDLATCSSKFELKVASLHEQTGNQYCNIVPQHCRCSHQKNIWFNNSNNLLLGSSIT